MITVLEDTKNLESMFKNKEKKEEIIALFEVLLNQKIADYNYISTEKFNSIIEYDFSLAKVNLILKNGEQKRIYLRMIKGGMIKETIFCYWSFLYEEYSNCNRNKVPQKVTITEKSIQENKKNIVLTVDKDLNYCTEICLVEIKKFLEKNNKFKNLEDYFNNNDKDILFLGII